MATSMRGSGIAMVMLLSAIACSSAPSSPVQPQGTASTSSATGGSTSSTVRSVSAAVMAGWTTHLNYADRKQTSLLLLWRGTPGWMKSPMGAGGGGSGSSEQKTLFASGTTLSIGFDYNRGLVSLLGQQLSLATTNVVLVDGADSPDGSRIVGTQWIDPAVTVLVSPGDDAIAAIIRRTPELYAYLQCDAELSDMVQQMINRLLCEQVRP